MTKDLFDTDGNTDSTPKKPLDYVCSLTLPNGLVMFENIPVIVSEACDSGFAEDVVTRIFAEGFPVNEAMSEVLNQVRKLGLFHSGKARYINSTLFIDKQFTDAFIKTLNESLNQH